MLFLVRKQLLKRKLIALHRLEPKLDVTRGRIVDKVAVVNMILKIALGRSNLSPLQKPIHRQQQKRDGRHALLSINHEAFRAEPVLAFDRHHTPEEMSLPAALGQGNQIVKQPLAILLLPVVITLIGRDDESFAI